MGTDCPHDSNHAMIRRQMSYDHAYECDPDGHHLIHAYDAMMMMKRMEVEEAMAM